MITESRKAILAMIILNVTLAQAEQELESMVVTGTYAPLPRPDLTSTISVLDQTLLSALNKRSVADALKTVPGVTVEEQGGAGGLNAVSIRGGEANFTVVMIDGVALNDPTNSRGGGYNFNNLDPAVVRHIEVVRGAQSAVYGSDALSGVVNIITRRPVQGHQQKLRLEGGERGMSDLSLSLTGSAGNLGYVIDLASRDSGELVAGSIRDNDTANLQLRWQVHPNHELSLAYRLLEGERSSYPEQSGGPLYAASDELDYSDYRDETFAMAWQAQFGDLWHSRLSGDSFELSEDFISPGVLPYTEVPPNGSDTDYRRDQLRWVNTLNVRPLIRINLGADYRDEQGDSEGYLLFGDLLLPTDFTLDRATRGLFAEVTANPTPALVLQASVRRDDPDDFDAETTFHVGASYELTPQLQLTGNWGQGFKLPSFFALGHGLVGNPELAPEFADSWDVGIAWAPDETLNSRLTYFSNDYEGLIDFDSELFINVNRNDVESRGLEFDFSWLSTTNLQLRGRATYLDLEQLGDSSVLQGRPEWQAGFTALWQLAPAWDTALDYQWTGEQYASSLHTGDTVVQQLDDYHRLDWTLRWRVQQRWQLQLAVDNLLDESYQTAVGFPGPGRGVRLAVSLLNE